MTTIRTAIHNIEKRRGNIRELTAAEIVLEIEAEIAKEAKVIFKEPEGVTAKEILTDKWGKSQMNDTTYPMQYLKNMALEAMEVYARTKQPGLREELIKIIEFARKGSMITSQITDNTYWKFDIDSTSKTADEYLKQSKSK